MSTQRSQRKGRRGQTPTSLLRAVRGGRYTPSADPPTITLNPWYQIVLTYDLTFPITPAQAGVGAGIYRLHGADIKSQLGTQLGLNLGDTNLVLRIQALSVWKLTSGPLGVTPVDPFGGDDSNALLQIEDSPAKNAWARCGYKYPEYIRDRPWFVKSDVVSHCAQVIVASPTDKAEVLIHLHLLFKYDTAAWPELRRYPGDEGRPPSPSWEMLNPR